MDFVVIPEIPLLKLSFKNETPLNSWNSKQFVLPGKEYFCGGQIFGQLEVAPEFGLKHPIKDYINHNIGIIKETNIDFEN